MGARARAREYRTGRDFECVPGMSNKKLLFISIHHRDEISFHEDFHWTFRAYHWGASCAPKSPVAVTTRRTKFRMAFGWKRNWARPEPAEGLVFQAEEQCKSIGQWTVDRSDHDWKSSSSNDRQGPRKSLQRHRAAE